MSKNNNGDRFLRENLANERFVGTKQYNIDTGKFYNTLNNMDKKHTDKENSMENTFHTYVAYEKGRERERRKQALVDNGLVTGGGMTLMGFVLWFFNNIGG